LTNKIHALTDTLGRPQRFILTGGGAYDSAAELIGRTPRVVTCDKACLRLIADAGVEAVIPSSGPERFSSLMTPWPAQPHRPLLHQARVANRHPI
jgi:hypothetical protein